MDGATSCDGRVGAVAEGPATALLGGTGCGATTVAVFAVAGLELALALLGPLAALPVALRVPCCCFLAAWLLRAPPLMAAKR